MKVTYSFLPRIHSEKAADFDNGSPNGGFRQLADLDEEKNKPLSWYLRHGFRRKRDRSAAWTDDDLDKLRQVIRQYDQEMPIVEYCYREFNERKSKISIRHGIHKLGAQPVPRS